MISVLDYGGLPLTADRVVNAIGTDGGRRMADGDHRSQFAVRGSPSAGPRSPHIEL